MLVEAEAIKLAEGKGDLEFSEDAKKERDSCLKITNEIKIASTYYTLTDGVKAHSEMCKLANDIDNKCALACNLMLNMMQRLPTKANCDALPTEDVKYKSECNDRVNGDLVWSSASNVVVGIAGLLTVSMALF